jgi:hypothetical protein
MAKKKQGNRKKRPIAVTVIGAAIAVLFVVRLYQIFKPLVDMGMFQRGVQSPFFNSEGVTQVGRAVLNSAFYSVIAVGMVIVLVGFLRMRRWSWVVMMSWVGISMVVGLVDYFYIGHPNYVIMASDMVIAFALCQADVQHIFGIRTDIGELLS